MKKSLVILIIIFIMFPVCIYADDDLSEEIDVNMVLTLSSIETNLEINSRHAVVIDRNSKRVLYGKAEYEKCKMASTTKIMTAIIVIENGDLNDIVKVSKKSAQIGGSRLGLSTDDEISVDNLLYGLMLCSGNDAAIALAEYIGGSVDNFINLMNEKANILGLSSTHFVTPHGLDDENHYTTAYDLACLTNYALNNDIFSQIVKTKNYTITINGCSKNLVNTNELLGSFDGIYGVKTGFTNGANRCLVTSCKRNNIDVICVVLGADTKKIRTSDSVKLLNYIFNNFVTVNVKEYINKEYEKWKILHVQNFNIIKAKSQVLETYIDYLELPYEFVTIKKSDLNSLDIDVNYNHVFFAPIEENAVVGKILLNIDNSEMFSINIKNKNTVLKKDFCDYFKIFLKNFKI